MKEQIKVEEIVRQIRKVAGDKIFAMTYERVAAKCPFCGKSNKKWNELDECPICGTKLSKFRDATCRLGVTDPKNCTAPGKGKFIGESFEEALAKGNLKYFDMNAENKDETIGCYRTAKIEKIKEIRMDGRIFEVKA